ANAAGRGGEMAAALERSLGVWRRHLHRHQAAGLWSDLGVGRAGAGDLAGAERAFLHAQRLLAGCDGPRRTTLALHNLAEIRLRRGRPAGVEAILERSLEENRMAGNLRGQIHDLALWARHELVLGRPAAALGHCHDALELLDRKGSDWHRAELRLLEARAHGLLGDPDAARRAVQEVGPDTPGELEPEERPALFALAGLPDEAREAARGTALEALWLALLDGEEPPARLWQGLEELEPYRAARLVRDAELLRPGTAPATWRRRAVAALRRIGAAAPAERLELADRGPWRALSRYLEGPARGLPEARRLFEEAGYPDVRIERRPEDGGPSGGGAEVLIGGAGGSEELSVPAPDGRLLLRAPLVDPAVRALFAVVARELAGPAVVELPVRDLPLDQGRGRRRPERDGLVGESPALLAAVERAGRLAAGDLPVLVLGESGTGKELVARLVHRRSPRAGKALVAVNCAALSENLLLSDLFGHVRGSFTGADRDRAGVFETAQGGTVFLDEIGDLPPVAQGMLLRVLQEGEVRRVGESLARTVDARVVAATHRDLAAMVRDGSFRQDLYFRLNVARVELPPLRERGRDVVLLAEHFLGNGNGDGGRRLSAEARSRLLAHPWPGNVRELENVLQVASALAGGGAVAPEHLELPEAAPAANGDYHARVEAYRRRLVEEALEESRGNQAEAARRLGLSRQAMSYLVKQLRLM
ncbi:MAG TPA: sigma 54-interacting transcriptional regulator, partial [Thermoanaerobaculia bacterium]